MNLIKLCYVLLFLGCISIFSPTFSAEQDRTVIEFEKDDSVRPKSPRKISTTNLNHAALFLGLSDLAENIKDSEQEEEKDTQSGKKSPRSRSGSVESTKDKAISHDDSSRSKSRSPRRGRSGSMNKDRSTITHKQEAPTFDYEKIFKDLATSNLKFAQLLEKPLEKSTLNRQFLMKYDAQLVRIFDTNKFFEKPTIGQPDLKVTQEVFEALSKFKDEYMKSLYVQLTNGSTWHARTIVGITKVLEKLATLPATTSDFTRLVETACAESFKKATVIEFSKKLLEKTPEESAAQKIISSEISELEGVKPFNLSKEVVRAQYPMILLAFSSNGFFTPPQEENDLSNSFLIPEVQDVLASTYSSTGARIVKNPPYANTNSQSTLAEIRKLQNASLV